jgi:hypothetical protein
MSRSPFKEWMGGGRFGTQLGVFSDAGGQWVYLYTWPQR